MVRRALRVIALFTPLLFLAALLALPCYSARLSLILHGHPFATVMPKENLDIFKFVGTDSFACRAIVFSRGKAIGWVMLPSTGGSASFVPFSGKPGLEEGMTAVPSFDFTLMMAWAYRWCFLLVQGGFLVLWWRTKRRPRPTA
jgi:hypothetical protein